MRGFGVLIILSVSYFLWSCGNKKESISDKSELALNTSDNALILDKTPIAKNISDSIFETLTLEEKIGQCFMPAIYSVSDDYTINYYKNLIEENHIGGIVLFKGDLSSARKIAELGAEANVPLFISIDAEWGLGMRLKDAPVFPQNGKIRKDVEENIMFDYGREVARECRNSGINMVLGPVVDIVESYKRGTIGLRSFGNDPTFVSNHAVAYAKGLESGGIISVAKHFPGHGSSTKDSHYGAAIIKKDLTSLDSVDFIPFKNYIDAGLSGVMAGHLKVPSINPDGIPASVSPEILTTLLREEMGFEGLVLTDSFDMGGAKGFSSEEAIKAGADLVLCPRNPKKTITGMIEKVKKGEIDVKIIEDRCKRILFYKALFGFWENIKIDNELEKEGDENYAKELIKNMTLN